MEFYEGCDVICRRGDTIEARGKVYRNTHRVYLWIFEATDGSDIAFTFTAKGWQIKDEEDIYTRRHVVPDKPWMEKFLEL